VYGSHRTRSRVDEQQRNAIGGANGYRDVAGVRDQRITGGAVLTWRRFASKHDDIASMHLDGRDDMSRPYGARQQAPIVF
jgi:hypothetical protein